LNKLKIYLILLLCSSASFLCYSQQRDSALNTARSSDSSISEIQDLPSKYYSKVDKKLSLVNDQLTKKSIKYLAKFQRQEQKLQRRLQQLHPELAVTDATQKYQELSQKIKSKTASLNKIDGGTYNSYLDSLGTTLSFLKQVNDFSDKVKSPLSSFDNLQNKLQQSEQIKEFIAERRAQIKELLSKYTHLPGSLKNEYDKLNKTAYYYSAQVQEYKNTLKDPKKIEEQALRILNKLPAFQKFMNQNSQLSSLFRIPANYGSAQNLTGLQTRSSVQSLIQQRIAAGGVNAQSQIQQNLAQAQGELNKIKDRLNQLPGGGSGDPELPNFKPNSQKTKKLFDRLEFGFNVQFAISNPLLPSTANLALTLGYKLDDKKSCGVGAGYILGMGTIKHISFTSQGLSLRSYFDWKIKKQFYASGGYEANYNSAFKNIEQLKNYNAWQRSCLAGISKKYKIGKKNGEMKILYDFFAQRHLPVSSPVLFRTGYSF